MSRAVSSTDATRLDPEVENRHGFHAARAEREHFRLAVKRSLSQNRGIAAFIVLIGLTIVGVYLWRSWPIYSAQAEVEIGMAHGNGTVADASSVQQQIQRIAGVDAVSRALDKVQSFQRDGESEQEAIERLSRSIVVERLGNMGEVVIRAQEGSAQMAADVANAVAASYVEMTLREQQAGSAGRVATMRQEADRLKKVIDDDRVQQEARAPSASQGGGGADALGRLQSQYDALDQQIQSLTVDDVSPGGARIVSPAVVPTHPIADGAGRNAAVLLILFLLLAVAAAVVARRLDQRIYVASDVEELVGFGPVAELPAFDEVSRGVFDEQVLRLAGAIETALRQGRPKGCVFTGTGAGTGVTAVASRVRAMIDDLSWMAVLVDAAGHRPAVSTGDTDEGAELGGVAPVAIVQRLTEESRAQEGIAVLADAAPLALSAETEYLARNTDCVVVVVESGRTTREELRAAARTLQRLDIDAVGYVLNRVKLARADAAFKLSLKASEEYAERRSETEKTAEKEARVEANPVERTDEAGDRISASEEARAESFAASPVMNTVSEQAVTAGEPIAEVAAQAPAQKTESAAPELRPRESYSGRPRTLSNMAEIPNLQGRPRRGQPWWLSDSLLRGDGAPDESRAAEQERLAEDEEDSFEPPTRLSNLRRLFTERDVPYIAGRRDLSQVEGSARRTVGVPLRRGPQEDGLLDQNQQSNGSGGYSDAALTEPWRGEAPEETGAAEFLPPQSIGDVDDGNSAGRLERIKAWDDVAILPSWRGQYRRKA